MASALSPSPPPIISSPSSSSSSSSPHLLLSRPHHITSTKPKPHFFFSPPLSLSLYSQLHSKTITHVSTQEDSSPLPPPPPIQETTPDSKSRTFKKTRYVNPNSPSYSQLIRSRGSSPNSRFSRLLSLSSTLDEATTPISIPATLSSYNPKPTTQQDAVVVLNNMSNHKNAVLVLRCFLITIAPNKIQPVILYNVTFKVLRKNKAWDESMVLWEEMLASGIKPDNVTFSTVISCARLCDTPEKAIEMFEKMPELGCTPDEVTYAVMIDAYGRAGNVDMALGLYDRARSEKWRLDRVIFATVIKVYADSGNFDGALNVFEEMKALQVEPNMSVYNLLLDVMARAERPWQVKSIFAEMVGKGMPPNRRTYSALLRAYCKARYSQDAFAVYHEMKAKGIDIGAVLYNSILAMCADVGLVSEAEEVFREMKVSVSKGSRPDSWSYSALITAYSCTGNMAEAERMLNEMIEMGFKSNIFVLTSLVQGFGNAGRADDVVRLCNNFMVEGFAVDDRFLGCLLNCAAQMPVAEVGKVIGCIEKGDAQLGSLVRLLVDEDVSSEVVKDKARELLSTVSNRVKKPYCNCLIDLCVNLKCMDKAFMLLDLAWQLEIYSNVQLKTPTQWSLHLKGLSVGAAVTTLHVWMDDLSAVLRDGEELPPLLGIHTGKGKHRYSEKGLASSLETVLRDLDAPFHEAPDKDGWLLTTSVAAKLWLEAMNPSEMVAV